jgi:hypothetical protein
MLDSLLTAQCVGCQTDSPVYTPKGITMRIHTDHLSESDIYTAARFARVDVVKLEAHGSRKRDHAFDVKLEGESRRAPNGGASGKGYATGKAATWDQWGVFLSVLFDLDDATSTPYDDGRQAFHDRTFDRFLPGGIVGTGSSTNANVVNVPAHVETVVYVNGVRQVFTPAEQIVHRIAGSYWPADAHGDHRFDYLGAGVTGCTKCSARLR